MPFVRSRYPANWEAFTYGIKTMRAGGRCECSGQCGLHPANPHVRRCTETNGTPGQYMRGKVILTTAHLCKCNPPCANASHVIAACQRCHLRIDSRPKAARRRARERQRRAALQPLLDDLGATSSLAAEPE